MTVWQVSQNRRTLFNSSEAHSPDLVCCSCLRVWQVKDWWQLPLLRWPAWRTSPRSTPPCRHPALAPGPDKGRRLGSPSIYLSVFTHIISDGVSGVTGPHLGLFSMRRRQLLIDLIQCPRQEDRWRLTNVSQLPNLKLLTTTMVTTMTPELRVMRMNICCQPRRSGSPELPRPSPAQAVFDISFSNGFYNPIVTILFISNVYKLSLLHLQRTKRQK